jgi:hypothetical protein
MTAEKLTEFSLPVLRYVLALLPRGKGCPHRQTTLFVAEHTPKHTPFVFPFMLDASTLPLFDLHGLSHECISFLQWSALREDMTEFMEKRDAAAAVSPSPLLTSIIVIVFVFVTFAFVSFLSSPILIASHSPPALIPLESK